MSHDFPIPRQDSRQDGPAGEDDPTAATTPDGIAGTTPDGAAVVAWGGADHDGRRTPPALARLGRDGRLVVVVAALGALAAFAAMADEWAITTLPPGITSSETPVQVADGLAQMSTFGTGYLLGILGLLGCLGLVFFGSVPVRHNLRILGLALAVGVLGVLATATLSLDALSDRWRMYGEVDGLRVDYGRGLILAYLGTAGLGLALLLAGRFVPRRPGPGPAAGGPAGSTDPAAAAEEPDWPWRRPRAATTLPDPDDDGDDRPPPIDLTVTPTRPFTPPER
ncbi:hypothetical protein [Plantactinospora sp. CA-290183]|uniref:hypothetical protein n=1 Tax=Plantactinospora sp. CA-290183 TaxID=3240006 RepID=UPI003D8C836B